MVPVGFILDDRSLKDYSKERTISKGPYSVVADSNYDKDSSRESIYTLGSEGRRVFELCLSSPRVKKNFYNIYTVDFVIKLQGSVR